MNDDMRRKSRMLILRAWVEMAKLFARLTPPIQLPMPEPGGISILEDAAHRARKLVRDMPLDKHAIVALDLALLEWLIAVTIERHESSERPDFATDVITASLLRQSLHIKQVGERLEE